MVLLPGNAFITEYTANDACMHTENISCLHSTQQNVFVAGSYSLCNFSHTYANEFCCCSDCCRFGMCHIATSYRSKLLRLLPMEKDLRRRQNDSQLG